ncbi:MAG: hypothetical protein P8X74_09395 [Reinekea sp.]|jgi:hypothetical protein
MNMEKQLEQLSQSSLKTLLLSLYGVADNVDDIIDKYLSQANIMSGSDAEIIDHYQQQLLQIVNGHDVYEYFLAGDFAQQLESLLDDFNNLVRPRIVTGALSLTEQFIRLLDTAMTMVDDADSEVGDIFAKSAQQWLAIAAEVRKEQPDYQDWIATIRELYGKNEFGCLDDLFSQSRVLLTEEELFQIARQLETEAQQALSASHQEGLFKAARACLALRGVAEALANVELMEKSFTLISPEPEDLEMAEIIKFCLKVNATERAQYWLNQSGWGRQHLHQQLTERLAVLS